MDRPRTVVQVEVDEELSELASDALWQADPSAVLEVDIGDGRVRLTADVADPAAVDPAWSPTVLVVDDDGYLDAWRSWATPIRAGRRTLLQPAWLAPGAESRTDDLVVVLDPGRTFGSGSHESTRLAVALLEDLVGPGHRVLDVGCGSGVLAVVAARLGATVVAIDVEPEAVAVTRANATANQVGFAIDACATELAAIAEAFDVVVANIGGGVLFDHADSLTERVVAGGALLLSGVLEDRVDPLIAACGGWAVIGRYSESGWGAIALRAPG